MAIKNLITDHLDLWTAAVRPKSSAGRGASSKLELTGIKKLRELILELAVRGKLVPQDPSDEPASVLLERIAAEKARLVKEKKIKKSKVLPEISEEEKPFELPEGWECIRLGELTSKMGSGSTPRGGQRAYVSEGIPFLRSQNVWNEGLKLDDVVYIDENTHLKMEGTKVIPGDVLLNITGASLGRALIFPDSIKEANVSQHVTIIRLLIDELAPFVHLGIKSPLVQDLIWGRQVGMAIEGLSKRTLELFEFPLPPLAEQQRIVAKVDELMALCDQLELRSESQLAAHQTLVEILLATLTDSADSDELAQNWARLSTHFDTLFTTEASIYALKQTILQLAVMGKLIPQDPSDEPASALLARIAAEKAQLVKEKKIKKEKPLPAISEEEKPFELPQGWEWCRFGTLVNFRAELVKPENFQSFDQVAPDSIEKGTGKLIKRRTVLESGVKGPNSRFYAGQILYSKIRPSLSKAIIADFDGLCSADMYPLDAMISSDFLLKIILSEVFLAQVRVAENRIKMPKLNVDSLSNILVPVCPESEMNRITSKITDLILVCDKLQSRLQTSQQTHLKLVDALVEQAL
ncbi:restriction endonuclease subunit S [Edwardsiella tarda]|uniref:restriction endonuclease subunit S n=1 Tax=Edwardsiella tarda TaxID=636 RepID=UPI00030E9771|nr:restriction endonuclease subunit S [Edwardsiella tarda]